MNSKSAALASLLLWPLAALAGEPVGDGFTAWYGVSHTHTGMTDGEPGSTPATAYGYAANHGLDWLLVSEHNHTCAGLESGEYQQGMQQAQAATQDGSFVALFGMEWGVSSGGHVVLFESPVTIGWSASGGTCGAGFYDVEVDKPNYSGPGGLYEAMWENPNEWGPVFGSFAHPHDDEYNGYTFGAAGKDVMRYVELIKGNGSWRQQDESQRGQILEDRFRWLLSRGWKVGALQSQDSHGHNWGSATADRTGVVAASLTKHDLMTALAARRTFVTQDKDAWMHLRAGGAWMGQELQPQAPVEMTVDSGDGEAEAFVRTTLYAGRAVPDEPVSVVAESPSGQLEAVVPVPQTDSYYYAVVQQADGDLLYSSPLWLLGVPATGTPGTTPTRTPTPPGPTRTPTPPGATPTRTPTPGATGGVVLNEYVPRPVSDWNGNGTASATDDEWIEIYNRGGSPVELSTLRLADPQVSFALPAGTLEPGCFRVYFRSQTGIALNSGADTVFLKDAAGQVLDQHSYSSDAPDQSHGRATDGGASWTVFASPTLNGPNAGGPGCPP